MEALPPLERNYRGKSLHGGSALTVETYTILPTSYDDYDDYDAYDAFSEHNCYGQLKSTYLLYLTQFMNSMFETYRREAMHSSSYRLRRYQHLHGAQTASATWTAIRTGIHRHFQS